MNPNDRAQSLHRRLWHISLDYSAEEMIGALAHLFAVGAQEVKVRDADRSWELEQLARGLRSTLEMLKT